MGKLEKVALIAVGFTASAVCFGTMCLIVFAPELVILPSPGGEPIDVSTPTTSQLALLVCGISLLINGLKK